MSEEFKSDEESYYDLTECNSMLYSDNYTNFDEWFYLVKNKQFVYPSHKIPYSDWFYDYINDIENRTITEVKDLVRCLLRPLNRPLDFEDYKTFKILEKDVDDEKLKMYNPHLFEYVNRMKNNERFIRIANDYDAFEGITWVLELLPRKPYKAVEALRNYLSAQLEILPDDMITGIEQCIQLILAKFIYFEEPAKKLLNLHPVEFELLIEELYQGMGYETTWTGATRDGGKDIIAEIDRYDGKEKVYVECKLYNTTKLDISKVGYFGYIIANEKINRGVIFCTGYVSENLKNFDRRIQIWTYEEIVFLLNAHLGSNWCNNLDDIIQRKKSQYRIK